MKFCSRKNGCRALVYVFIIPFFTNLCILPSPLYAQNYLNLPPPGALVSLSEPFTPPLLRGITIHPDQPFQFDFLFTSGDEKLSPSDLKAQSETLIKYFLTAMTVPEKDLWVNLSPYEQNRIIPDDLGRTDMGRDLLAEDYILKELSASLMYPEKELGKSFWNKVYKKAREEYGTVDIPVNTFNKVWIVAESATVYERGNRAFVVDGHLKVLLEEDLEAFTVGARHAVPLPSEKNREVIQPEIEREVNQGRHFARLRQIYHSLILATWFKKKLQENVVTKVYADKNKVRGIDTAERNVKQQVYEQYLEAYRKGVYNYIKEELDPQTQELIPRKYFSGGTRLAQAYRNGEMVPLDRAMLVRTDRGTGERMAGILKEEEVFENRGDLNVSPRIDKALLSQLPWPFADLLNGRGKDSPEWLEAYMSARVIVKLVVNQLRGQPTEVFEGIGGDKISEKNFDPRRASLRLDEVMQETREALNSVFVKLAGDNQENEFRLIDAYVKDISNEAILKIINGLRSRGLITSSDGEPFVMKLAGQKQKILMAEGTSPRLFAVWSDDYEFIKDDLEGALRQKDPGMVKQIFLNILDEYEEIVKLWENMAPKEAMDPILRAIASMSVEDQDNMAEIIFSSYSRGREPLADSIVLMLKFNKAIESWLSKQAGHLVGRDIVISVAEFESIKGGLGRVIKYYTEYLKLFGVNLIVIQPRYRGVRDAQGNFIERGEANFGLKLINEHEIKDRQFNTYVEGKEVRFKLFKSFYEYQSEGRTESFPVYSFEDIPGNHPKILGALYEHDRADAAPASEWVINTFISKASAEVYRYIEVQAKRERGNTYKSAVLDAHDGQMLPMLGWLTIFYGEDLMEKLRDQNSNFSEEEKRYIEDTLPVIAETLMSATTHTYGNRVTIENFQEGLNRLRAEGVSDHWLWLFLRKRFGDYLWDSSSGGLRPASVKRGVAGVQAYENYDLDPGGGPLVGIANGDHLEFTSQFFRKHLGNISMEQYFNITSEQGAVAKAAAKQNLKFYLYDRNEAGQVAYADFFERIEGREPREAVSLNPAQLVVSYSGRGVSEKLGMKTAIAVIEDLVKNGVQVVIAANQQAFPESEALISDLKTLREDIYKKKQQFPEKYTGQFIIVPHFTLDQQRELLAATDLQFQPSNRRTEAAGASEAHAAVNFALQMSPPYWEGILSRIGTPINWENGTGSVVVPADNTPKAWLAAILRVNQEFLAWQKYLDTGAMPDGARGLPHFQSQALKMSRVYSASLTVAAFLRFWNKAFDKPLREKVKPRIPGEVRLNRRVLNFSRSSNHQGRLEGDTFKIPKGKEGELGIPVIQIIIDRDVTSVINVRETTVLPELMIEAFLRSTYGVEIPFKSKTTDKENRIVMEAEIPRGFPEPSEWRINVGSGIGYYDGPMATFKIEAVDEKLDLFEVKPSSQKKVDAAMVAAAEKEPPGGILLDPSNMKMNVEKDASSSETGPSFLPAGFEEENFPGFYWNTINVTPVLLPALPELLGLDMPMDKEEKVDVSLKS